MTVSRYSREFSWPLDPEQVAFIDDLVKTRVLEGLPNGTTFLDSYRCARGSQEEITLFSDLGEYGPTVLHYAMLGYSVFRFNVLTPGGQETWTRYFDAEELLRVEPKPVAAPPESSSPVVPPFCTSVCVYGAY